MEEPDLRSLKEDMVERVAEAMMNADWGDYRPLPPDVSLKNYYTMARAAIQAMREPSSPMLVAGTRVQSDRTARGYFPANMYRAMIDAALQGHEVSGSP